MCEVRNLTPEQVRILKTLNSAPGGSMRQNSLFSNDASAAAALAEYGVARLMDGDLLSIAEGQLDGSGRLFTITDTGRRVV